MSPLLHFVLSLLYPTTTATFAQRHEWRRYPGGPDGQLPRRAGGGGGLLCDPAAAGQRPSPGRPSVAPPPVRRRGRPAGLHVGLFPRRSHAVLRYRVATCRRRHIAHPQTRYPSQALTSASGRWSATSPPPPGESAGSPFWTTTPSTCSPPSWSRLSCPGWRGGCGHARLKPRTFRNVTQQGRLALTAEEEEEEDGNLQRCVGS